MQLIDFMQYCTIGQTNLNGSWWAQANPVNSIIYASPYVVCTPQGYTKHYYAGSERIASKTGGGGIIDLAKIITELLTNAGIWKRTFEPLWTKRLRMLPPEIKKEATCITLYDLRKVREKEKDTYYYHPDHLGSASWITNSDGRPIQHLQYLPFGEPRIDQRAISWHSRYTFSAKEKDEESPYSYFGARYYDAELGIWTSVDKAAAFAPHVTPYAYCLNNPIKLIDPDGNFAIPIHKNITHQAMARSGIVSKTSSFFYRSLVWGATYGADVFGAASDWHFDGRANYSAVQSRWNSLNTDITTTISNIGGGNKLLGGSDVKHLGKLIHNVQDFYAHSNYVELYIEYYQGQNGGDLPTSVPTYDDGINITGFNSLLQDKLRTGDFNIIDNEKIDIDPFHERASQPTSHNKMNKDNANTYAGKLAKEAAIKHTTKILKKVE
jgi:RHS repeat-associated protein